MSISGGLVILSTFLASSVEWVEALTIVLAVGIYRSWRSALIGVGAAFVCLAALVAVFGVALTAYLPITAVETVVGVLLLLFGLKWLQKSILRTAHLKAMRDEGREFEELHEELEAEKAPQGTFDTAAFATSFNGVFLEGLEVVFIVVALGGLHNVSLAVIGAGIGLVVVLVAGVALRHPLTRVPENAMKYVVGIMLSAFGTFFAGEGVGIQWWQNDLSILLLIGLYALLSLALVGLLRNARSLVPARPNVLLVRARDVVMEIWGLFVDDGLLAALPILGLLASALAVSRASFGPAIATAILVGGVAIALSIGLRDGVRNALKRRPAAQTVELSDPRLDPIAAE